MRMLAATCALLLLTGCQAPERLQAGPGPAGREPSELSSAGHRPAGSDLQPQARATPPPGSLEASVPLVAWNGERRVYQLQLVDTLTGLAVSGRATIDLGNNSQYLPQLGISPAGSHLAAIVGVGSACESVAGGSACRQAADLVRIIDLRTGAEVQADLRSAFAVGSSPFKGWVSTLAFRPDGRRLALVFHHRGTATLLSFATDSAELVGQLPVPIEPRFVEFSSDGTALVLYGSPPAEAPGLTQPDPPSTIWLDADTLDVLWTQELSGVLEGIWCLEGCGSQREVTRGAYWSPAVAFSPDRKELYVVHADADRLTRVELLTRTVRTLAIGPRETWIERLLALTAQVAEAKYWPEGASKTAALSPDGGRLFVAGQRWDRLPRGDGEWELQETALGLRVVELPGGTEAAQLAPQAHWLEPTADRRFLLIRLGPIGLVEVRDAQSLEWVGSFQGWELTQGRRLDGRPIVLLRNRAGDAAVFPTQFAVLELEPFALTAPWTFSGTAYWVPDP